MIQKPWLLPSGAVEQAASVAPLLYCFLPETSSVLSPLQVMPVSSERVRQAFQKFLFSPVWGGRALKLAALKWFLCHFPLFVLRCRFPPLVCSTPGKIQTTCKLSRQGSSLKEVIIRRLKLAVEQAASSLGNTWMLHTDRGGKQGELPWMQWLAEKWQKQHFPSPSSALKYCFFFNFCALLLSIHINHSSAEAFLPPMLCLCLDFFFFSFPHLPLFLLSQRAFLHGKWQPPAPIVKLLQMGTATFTAHNCLWAGAGPAGTESYKWTISSQVVDWSWLFLLLPWGDRSGKAKH